MNCRDLIEFLGDYFSRDLPPGQHAEFERHLGLCPPCRHYLEAYEQTIRLGKAACEDESLPPLPEALIQAILAARGRRDGG